MIPAIAPPPGDVLGLKERNIHDCWSPADDPFMPREVFRGAHLHRRHRWRCVRQQCPAGQPSACISISMCMYPSVEVLSETRYLNRAPLSLCTRTCTLQCAAAAEHRKQSASPATHANDTLHSMVVKLIS